MTHDRVHDDVRLATGGVDRSVAAGDRVHAGLQRAQSHLVAPVEAFLVGTALAHQAHISADIAHLRVGERSDELGEGVRLPADVRVGERHDLATRSRDGGVLRADLPAARELQDEVGARRPSTLYRFVGRAVGGDDQLESAGGIVEGAKVGDALRDHVLLGVRGDDY